MGNTTGFIKYAALGAAISVVGYALYRNFVNDKIKERDLLVKTADILMQFSDRARENLIPLNRQDIANHILLQSKLFNQLHNTSFRLAFTVAGGTRYSAVKVVTLKGQHCKQEVRVYCN